MTTAYSSKLTDHQLVDARSCFMPPVTPYYVYAPSWTHTSSGVRALHLLVHLLNSNGQRAYLLTTNDSDGYAVNPNLCTPFLTGEYFNYYKQSGIEPICVYPDVIRGNPYGGKKVVRWLLAPAGAYGGDSEFPVTDKVYGYRSDIAYPTLCLPTFDTSVFYPPQRGTVRSGTCFYSHKYDKIHGNKLFPVTDGSIRLEGTPEEISFILRQSEKCFVYEMSELIVLAKMCGCPVELIITDYFKGVPSGWDFESGDNEKFWLRFFGQLERFIEDTQNWEV